MKTKKLFHAILESELFRINGRAIDLPEIILELCQAIQEEEETNWDLGESLDCTLADFIAGAYWSFTENHKGQNSVEYRALSALGDIYSPGYASTPEEEDEPGEYVAYSACNAWFEAKR
jgi:hypothetical protein